MAKSVVVAAGFLCALLCIVGLVLSTIFEYAIDATVGTGIAFGGLVAYVLGQVGLFASRKFSDSPQVATQVELLFCYSFWVSLGFMNAIGGYRFLFALEFMVLGPFGIDLMNRTAVNEIRECATGYVTVQPKCTDLAYPSGHFLVYDKALYLHIIGGATALLLGPFQLSKSFRQKHRQAHRVMGRIYAVAVPLGAVGSVILCIHTVSGLIVSIGFLGVAFLWIVTLVPALYHIRKAISHSDKQELYQQHIEAHRRWMYRNYSMTFATVLFRLYFTVIRFLDVPYILSYQIATWLSWVPNLFIVEYYLRYHYSGTAVVANKLVENENTMEADDC